VNPPSELEPLLSRCMACSGDGQPCEKCGGAGEIRISSCPKKLIETDAIDLIEAARFLEDGILPIQAGYLDQTAAFLDGVRFYRGEMAALLAAK
jgi:hypothetical protein